jgi:glutamine---fructose-6-phosphate transaminase (isomerizing)
MNLTEQKYGSFSLVREMLETSLIVKKLDAARIASFAKKVKGDKVFFTGEGSSRIFPSKKLIADAWRFGFKEHFHSEAATQALEYALKGSTVFVASNSGKTKEGVRLIRHLREVGQKPIIGVIATAGSPIQLESDEAYLLSCGKEDAVAATKSVIEQALFYDILFRKRNGKALPDLAKLGDLVGQALEARIPEEVVAPLVNAKMLYWAGRCDGVAEELTLKTNEITRKKSDYLEGTYAVHGIEEVMNPDDAIVIVNPYKSEEEKFAEVLKKGVGLPVVAITHGGSSFPSFVIPAYDEFTPYIELAAGWNLLVEIGVRLGINLDKPVRARKIGNEFVG